MRDARHGTPARDEAVPGRTARRAASRLLLALLVVASCTGDDIVEPYGPARNLTAPGADALTHPQHVRVKSLSDGQVILGSTAVLKRRSTGLTVRVRTRELDPFESVDSPLFVPGGGAGRQAAQFIAP